MATPASPAANSVRPLSKLSTGLQPARDIPVGMVYDTDLKFIPERHQGIRPLAIVKTLDFCRPKPHCPKSLMAGECLIYTSGAATKTNSVACVFVWQCRLSLQATNLFQFPRVGLHRAIRVAL